MHQRPYALVSASVLERLRVVADGAIDSWCRDWGADRGELALECQRAWDGAPQLPAHLTWHSPWADSQASLAQAWSADLPAQIQRLLFGADRQYAPAAAPARLAADAGQAAWRALLQALSAALLPGGRAASAEAPPPAEAWRHASGAVLLALRIGKQACFLLLNHAAVLRHTPPAPPGAPLAAPNYGVLLADLALTLPVKLGSAQVDLGSLARLAVGDVIRLDSAADRALTVHGPAGTPLFDGYLGRVHDYMALELAPLDLSDGVKHEQ
jgi:flagellar motor switch/type III secretory pathway protein FliN